MNTQAFFTGTQAFSLGARASGGLDPGALCTDEVTVLYLAPPPQPAYVLLHCTPSKVKEDNHSVWFKEWCFARNSLGERA